MKGIPIPYTLHGDSVISIVIIACFCTIVILSSRYSKFLWRQIKFFIYSNPNDSTITETAREVRFLLILAFIDCLMLSLATYFYAAQYQPTLHFSGSSHRLLLLFSATFIGYFLLKWCLYSLVNITLFDAKKNLQWSKQYLLLIVLEGIFLYPVVVLHTYLDVDIRIPIIFYIIILFLNKILSFYKCKQIFFAQKDYYLQNILYFCALEITPLLALSGLLKMMIDGLKIFF